MIVKPMMFYMIISLGFRVRSSTGTNFRIWANTKLKEYITKGFVLDDDRFKSGTQMSYFDELQKRLRDIRISEKFFYQKIKDIYMTSGKTSHAIAKEKSELEYQKYKEQEKEIQKIESIKELEEDIKYLK